MKPYPSYKESGVDWIGDIPSRWGVRKIKYLFEINKRISGGLGYDVLSITQQGIKIKDITSGEGQLSMDYSKYQIVKSGDFAMNHMDLLTGYVDISKYDGVTSPDYRVFSLTDKESVDIYYLYIFQFCYLKKILYSFGQGSSQLGRWRLPTRQFNNFYIPCPGKQEQQQISSFLDHKTQQIDSLIEKTQQKIELLKEQRTSLINQVVTKGLNPDVEMKDSGVEWIGEIPSEWSFLKLWLIVKSSQLGGNYNSTTEVNDYPLIKMGNIGRGKVVLDKIDYFDKEGEFDVSHFLNKGDFLFNTRNSRDLVGKVTLWNDELGSSLYNSNILRLKFNQGILDEYMCYLFNSNSFLDVLKLISKGTTNVSAIYYKDLSKLEVVVPPPSEQQQIVDYLDQETSKNDSLIEMETQRINLLKEYRQSLISEVVTGKVDVRDEVVA